MSQKSEHADSSSEQIVKNIRRATRKRHSAEEKIRIVLDGLRDESSIAEWRFSGVAHDDSDRERVGLIAATVTECWRQQRILTLEAEEEARRLVEQYWAVIADLALALVNSPTRRLGTDEIWQVLRRGGLTRFPAAA